MYPLRCVVLKLSVSGVKVVNRKMVLVREVRMATSQMTVSTKGRTTVGFIAISVNGLSNAGPLMSKQIDSSEHNRRLMVHNTPDSPTDTEVQSDVVSEDEPAPGWICELCNVICKRESNMNQHMKSKKHYNMMARC
jgi:hypothetical protein